jgi:hypothetical protein
MSKKWDRNSRDKAGGRARATERGEGAGARLLSESAVAPRAEVALRWFIARTYQG